MKKIISVVLIVSVSWIYCAAENLIEDFESAASWNKITSQGALLETGSPAGVKGNAVSMKFDFGTPGYVVIAKEKNISLPPNFKLRFSIKGESPENTLEFKLIDRDGNVFWKKWIDYNFPKNWTEMTVKKKELVFAWGPNAGATLKDVAKIEIAISCGKGGKGEVSFDELVLNEIQDNIKKFSLTATASTGESGELGADKAVDGKRETRWSSVFEDNQWLLLDLGKDEEIVGMNIKWETAYTKVYDILVSRDKSNWTKAFSTEEADGDTDEINFPKQTARYVKLDLKKRGTSYGNSIYEVTLKGKDQEVFFSASSEDGKNKVGNIFDGNGKTQWRSAKGEVQWIILDMQAPKEYGGLYLYWDRDFAVDYDVLQSNDKTNWVKLYSVKNGNGERDRIFVKDGEAQYIKLDLKKSSGGQGYGLKDLEIKGPEDSASPQKLFEIAAEESPKGYYPKYFFNKQAYWTIIGVTGDVKESLFGTEGAFEVDKERFSLEPFLFIDGKFITWGDVKITQGMEKGYLPVPSVTWETADKMVMTEKICATGEPGKSAIAAWYNLKNNSDKVRSGKIFIAVRPFQVNPPWQCLNMVGGLAKIESISFDGKIISVNKEKKVIPVSKPDAFGATTYDSGDITTFITKGAVPKDKEVKDDFSYASGALEYGWTLNPGESRDVFVAVPFEESMLDFVPNMEKEQALQLMMKKFDDNIKYWDSKVSSFEIHLPGADSKIVDVMKSNLAYILINKDKSGFQPGSRSYNRSWIRDGAMTSSALLKMGMIPEVKEYAQWYSGFIFGDGKVPCAVDYRGAEHCPENDSNGEFIYLCKQYYNYTKDKQFLLNQAGQIIKAADYIITLRNQRKGGEYQSGPDEKKMLYGLVPESISHEGYSAKPMHSYWDDFFALKGMKDAAKIMEIISRNDMRDKYAREAADFRMCIYNSIKLSMKIHKIDYIPGCAELGDFDATSTSIGIYPCDEFDFMPKTELKTTMERYYKDLEKRLIPDNNWGEAFTPYELRTVRSFIYMEDKDKAHAMLDYFFTTMRPNAWNHWAEVVFRDIDNPRFIGDMPHTWVGSDYINSARSMLVIENENNDSLTFCKAVRDKWLDDKDGVWVKNLPTVWGNINFELKKTAENTVSFKLSGNLAVPGNMLLTSPLGKPIKSVKLDGTDYKNFSEKEITFKKFPAEITVMY